MLSLPPELVDHILGFIHRDGDIHSLKVCSQSLAESGSSALADRWLYREIRVYNGYGRNASTRGRNMLSMNTSQLQKLLTSGSNSHPGTYVHTLRISLSTPSIISWLMFRSLGDGEIAPLLSTPGLMPSLRSLALTASKGDTVPWRRCDDSFKRAFLSRLTEADMKAGLGAPNHVIEEVKIRGVEDFPVRVLERCTGLKKVHLEGRFDLAPVSGHLLPDVDPTPIDEDAPSKLHHLALHHCSSSLFDLTSWLASTNTISSLRTLDFRTHRADDLTHIPTILGACSESLEELEVDWGREAFSTMYDLPPSTMTGSSTASAVPTTLPTYLPLNSMPCLRKLTIHTAIESELYFAIFSQGEEMLMTRRYRSSIREIGEVLRAATNRALVLSEVELNLALVLDGPDAPSLAEVDFEPLSRMYASRHRVRPRITIIITSAKRSCPGLSSPKTIPFSSLLSDMEENRTLRSLMGEGRLRVVKGYRDPEEEQSRRASRVFARL